MGRRVSDDMLVGILIGACITLVATGLTVLGVLIF